MKIVFKDLDFVPKIYFCSKYNLAFAKILACTLKSTSSIEHRTQDTLNLRHTWLVHTYLTSDLVSF